MKYFTYSSYHGFDYHDTKKEAIDEANKRIEESLDDEWCMETESICWGEIKQTATESNRRPCDCGGDHQFDCDFKLEDN